MTDMNKTTLLNELSYEELFEEIKILYSIINDVRTTYNNQLSECTRLYNTLGRLECMLVGCCEEDCDE